MMGDEKERGIWQYFVFGILLIFLAFLSGSQQNVAFSFLGFLSFFVLGVTLIIEGFKRYRKKGS